MKIRKAEDLPEWFNRSAYDIASKFRAKEWAEQINYRLALRNKLQRKQFEEFKELFSRIENHQFPDISKALRSNVETQERGEFRQSNVIPLSYSHKKWLESCLLRQYVYKSKKDGKILSKTEMAGLLEDQYMRLGLDFSSERSIGVARTEIPSLGLQLWHSWFRTYKAKKAGPRPCLSLLQQLRITSWCRLRLLSCPLWHRLRLWLFLL